MLQAMHKESYLWLCGVLFSILSISVAIAGTTAPSQACRTLARQFAETPEQLSDDDVARLRTCVQEDLKQRISSNLAKKPPKGPIIMAPTP
jgi:hypothetical protein